MAVSAGGEHTCAIRTTGELVCFGCGEENEGQCDVPASLGPVVAVSVGVAHTCAMTAGWQLVCFGLNDDGQCDLPLDMDAGAA